VFDVTKAFIDEMLARGAGVIVNITSIGGVVGIPDRLADCTSKSAVVGLTKSLAIDHATQSIRVNCVCPGRVETPFVTARLREYSDPEEAYREMALSQAIGRIGKPKEIAVATLYLVSDEAAFITGTALIIDGGGNIARCVQSVAHDSFPGLVAIEYEEGEDPKEEVSECAQYVRGQVRLES
jgi:2-keto-3-deoxy-L-fuconate dehydrogenase